MVEQTCPQCKCVRLIEKRQTEKPNFSGLCIRCSGIRKRTKVKHTCPQCGCVGFAQKRHAEKLGFTGMCYACSRGKSSLTHGETGTKLHSIWIGMKQRCCNPAHSAYASYGGRGITICERWLRSYESFRDDMGSPPKGMSLDRIDNSRGYEPGNCRWATHKEQMNNMRGNRLITFDGQTQTTSQWAGELGGVKAATISHRIWRGWPVERALTAPLGSRR